MKKEFGILVDSSCGLSKKKVEAMGFYFIPIIIEINGKEYFSGINIENNFLFKQLKSGAIVKTAAIKYGELKNSFDKVLEECENLLFISLSKHLSSINETAKKLAREYNGKVIVYDSEMITPWIKERLAAIQNTCKNGGSLEEIIEILDKQKGKMRGYVSVDNLKFLYQGGRITRKQYLAGNLLKIIPTIVIENGVLNKTDVLKTRTINRTFDRIIELTLQDKEELEKEGYNCKIAILNINSKKNYKLLKDKLAKRQIINLLETTLSTEIIAHLGPSAIGIGVFIK